MNVKRSVTVNSTNRNLCSNVRNKKTAPMKSSGVSSTLLKCSSFATYRASFLTSQIVGGGESIKVSAYLPGIIPAPRNIPFLQYVTVQKEINWGRASMLIE